MIYIFLGALSTPSAVAVSLLIGTTVAAWTIFLGSLTSEVLGRPSTMRRLVRLMAMRNNIVVSFWSIEVLAAAASSAARWAGGQPYCIAQQAGIEDRTDYRTVRSIFGLQGSHVFSDRTGYKDTSRWYFNEILVVDDGNRKEYFNW